MSGSTETRSATATHQPLSVSATPLRLGRDGTISLAADRTVMDIAATASSLHAPRPKAQHKFNFQRHGPRASSPADKADTDTIAV